MTIDWQGMELVVNPNGSASVIVRREEGDLCFEIAAHAWSDILFTIERASSRTASRSHERVTERHKGAA